jgi:hypothetical protein
LDTTALVVTSPRSAAKQFAQQDKARFAKAAAYFFMAFSSAIVLTKISFTALGIETINEPAFWAVHFCVILCVTVLAIVLAAPLKPSPSSWFLKTAFLAYGAGFLISSFLLAGASLTLVSLRGGGYVPDFRINPSAVENFEIIGTWAYLDCLRSHSTLFATLYSTAGGPFNYLPEPLVALSWVQPAFEIASSFMFAALSFFGATRRKWGAALAAALSCSIIFISLPFGLRAYKNHLDEKTHCLEQAVQEAWKRTAEDEVRMMAENFNKNMQRDDGPLRFMSAEAQQKSLIVRVRVSDQAFDRIRFERFARDFGRRLIQEYCGSERGARFRAAGIAEVWVMRYGESELVETIVQSADQCKR